MPTAVCRAMRLRNVSLRTARPIAFDLAGSLAGAGRFVVVDDRRIFGGGVILEALSPRNG